MKLGLFFIVTLITSCYAKFISDVFTSLGAITYASDVHDPYGFYNMVVYWKLTAAQNPQTGDTFQLVMPDVAEIRITENKQFVDNLDIIANGRVIASCNVYQSLWETNETKLICTITANEITDFKALQGNIQFLVVFFGGGTIKQMSYGSKFTVGANKVSFNDGQLTGTVNFINTKVPVSSFKSLTRNSMGSDSLYYFLAPQNLCGTSSIKSGSFLFEIQSKAGSLPMDPARTGLYFTASLNDFDYPITYGKPAGLSAGFSNLKNTYRATFGTLNHNQYLWFTTFHQSTFIIKGDVTFNIEISGVCKDGLPFKHQNYVYPHTLNGQTSGSGSGISEYKF